MATKKKNKMGKVYIAVPMDAILVENNLEDAKERAKGECEISGTSYEVLEVVRAWSVMIPEEPEPEVIEEDLEVLFGAI